VEASIQGRRTLIEVDDANRIHLEANEVVFASRKNGCYLSEDEEAASGPQLQDYSEVGSDERRSAPGDLKHRTKEMIATCNWEDAVEIADDLRSVANGILREHQAVEGVVLETGSQGVLIEGAVDGE
jgi:hypothetical protein